MHFAKTVGVIDKPLKILICLLLVFGLFFTKPKQEVEAAGPLLLVPILGGIVGDIAVDMGIDFIDKKAQKAASDNIAKKLWDKYGAEIQKWKPTKKNVGKWALEVPKWFIAGAVDEIGDYAKQVKPKSKEKEKTNREFANGKSFTKTITGETDPFYNTDVHVKVGPKNSSSQEGYAFVLKYGYLEVSPKSYAQNSGIRLCFDSTNCISHSVPGGQYLDYGIGTYNSNKGVMVHYDINPSGYTGDYYKTDGQYYGKNYVKAFEKYKSVLNEKQREIYDFEGVLVTDDVETVIQLDNDLTPSQLKELDYSKLPTAYQNDREFEFDIEPTLNIDLGEYEEGQEIEWEVIQQDIQYKVDNDTIYNTYNFDYEPVINNYYTLTPEKQNDLDKQIIIIIENDIDNGVDIGPVTGGGSGDGFKYCVDKESKEVVSCKDIEAVDGGILTYIKNSYDYAVNAVKAGVDGINTIVAGSAGLMTLYSNIFDWLPDEATTILVSGMLLMIGLRVFRK